MTAKGGGRGAQSPRPGEGFGRRWSRLKQATDGAQPPDSPVADAAPEAAAQPALRDEDMPPLESLTPESDYRGFLSPEVSDGLRRLALRKLFHGPEFNLCDGLDDYAEDFTGFEKLAGIVTADMRHRIEQEARKLAANDGEPEAAWDDRSPPPSSSPEGNSDELTREPGMDASPELSDGKEEAVNEPDQKT